MPEHILVVDDDIDMVHIIKSTLEKSGYEVVTAADGDEALQAIKKYTPDLMIIDLTMPYMNGWKFSAKVREQERFRTTPIIVLSGLIQAEKKSEQYEAGSYYMPKPFDIFKLMDKVKELLKEAHPQKGTSPA